MATEPADESKQVNEFTTVGEHANKNEVEDVDELKVMAMTKVPVDELEPFRSRQRSVRAVREESRKSRDGSGVDDDGGATAEGGGNWRLLIRTRNKEGVKQKKVVIRTSGLRLGLIC